MKPIEPPEIIRVSTARGRVRRFGRGRAGARSSPRLFEDRPRAGVRRVRLLRPPLRAHRGTGGQPGGMTGADPRQFLYRSLDPDGARRLAATHLSACDDGELYLQYSASESFGFDDGRLKTADFHTSSGFGLRGVTGETTAFAHANEISEAAIEPRRRDPQIARSAQGRGSASAAADQPGDVRVRRPVEPDPVRAKGRAVRADRR